jgi:hypothetical protein
VGSDEEQTLRRSASDRATSVPEGNCVSSEKGILCHASASAVISPNTRPLPEHCPDQLGKITYFDHLLEKVSDFSLCQDNYHLTRMR